MNGHKRRGHVTIVKCVFHSLDHCILARDVQVDGLTKLDFVSKNYN